MRCTLLVTLLVLLAAAAPTRAADPFAGIAQHGFAVGDPAAPLTVYAYVEPQCPSCRAFFADELGPSPTAAE